MVLLLLDIYPFINQCNLLPVKPVVTITLTGEQFKIGNGRTVEQF